MYVDVGRPFGCYNGSNVGGRLSRGTVTLVSLTSVFARGYDPPRRSVGEGSNPILKFGSNPTMKRGVEVR